MTINEWLQNASFNLRGARIKSARLDAELLLGYILNVERSWLHAHDTTELEQPTADSFEKLIKRRLEREPIAYITGRKEFYGLDFIVTPDVLIPRPETEDIIELAKQYAKPNGRVLDVGTGSGCIGITLKLEQPSINITLSDVSPATLDIARKNARKLGAKPIRFVTSDLLEHWLYHDRPRTFDMIIANLPYVDTSWTTSPETAHEPHLALYAQNGGLELIYRLIEQCDQVLTKNGFILLEADPEQHPAIIQQAAGYGYVPSKQHNYALLLTRR